jgi:hypothetical protein
LCTTNPYERKVVPTLRTRAFFRSLVFIRHTSGFKELRAHRQANKTTPRSSTLTKLNVADFEKPSFDRIPDARFCGGFVDKPALSRKLIRGDSFVPSTSARSGTHLLSKQWELAETGQFQRNFIDKGFPVMDANQRTEKSVARFKPE